MEVAATNNLVCLIMRVATRCITDSSYKKVQSSTPTAADKVFNTFELLEAILLNAFDSSLSSPEQCRGLQEWHQAYYDVEEKNAMKMLLSAQRINRFSNELMKNSKPLQSRLWYTSPPGEARANPLLAATLPHQTPRSDLKIWLPDFYFVEIDGAIRLNNTTGTGTESWGKMLVGKDVSRLQFWIAYEFEEIKDGDDVCVDTQEIAIQSSRVTMGMVMSEAEKTVKAIFRATCEQVAEIMKPYRR